MNLDWYSTILICFGMFVCYLVISKIAEVYMRTLDDINEKKRKKEMDDLFTKNFEFIESKLKQKVKK